MQGAAPIQALAASIFCLTSAILPGFLTGALGNDIKAQFDIGDTGLGVTLAVTYALSAVATVHAGEFADRIGPRRSLQIAMSLALLGYAGVAIAPTFVTFLAALALTGAGLTVAGPAAKVLVAQHITPDRQGIAFGIHMSAIPLAPLLAGLTVPLVGGTSGWRWAFVGAASLAIVALVMLPPDRLPPVMPIAKSSGGSGRFGHVQLGPLFVFAVAATLAASAVIGAASFFVINGDEAGISEDLAGLLLSVASAGVIITRITLGARADRGRSGSIGTVATLLAASAAGYALMAADEPWMYAIGGQLAIILGWSWPGLMVVALVRMNPHAPGLASAFTVSGLNAGSVIGPAAYGLISDAASSSLALAVSSASALGAASLSLLARWMLKESATRS